MAASTEFVLPGDRLGSMDDCEAGAGAYADDDSIYAAKCGYLHRDSTAAGTGMSTASKQRVSVLLAEDASLVPQVGELVTARVLKVTPRMVVTEMLCIGSKSMPVPFKGIVRLQDIRAMEIDKISVSECFRPGDLIRAEVLSLGTMRDYYLTTAKNELGVIWANSLAGAPLVAISWEEMQCPITAQTEKRKVAKVAQATA